MKVMFLDIDGVLNDFQYRAKNMLSYIDKSKMPLIKRIVDNTGAETVLTSSWRKGWFFGEDADIFNGNYIDNVFAEFEMKVFSKTPVLDFGSRADEIRMWLNENMPLGIESFVILDDIDFFSGADDLGSRFVMTSGEIGITDENAEKAISILNEMRYL